MQETLFNKMVSSCLIESLNREIETKPIKRLSKMIDNDNTEVIYTVNVPLPKNMLKNFSITKDCAAIVLIHMSETLLAFSREKNINHDQLYNLAKIVVLYINELDKLNPQFDSCNDLATDLQQLMKKYKKNNPIKNNLRRVFLLISLLQKSYLDT
jgi:hypothetical protein